MSDADLVAELRTWLERTACNLRISGLTFEDAKRISTLIDAIERLDADAAGEKAEKESLKLEVERLRKELEECERTRFAALTDLAPVIAERDRLIASRDGYKETANQLVTIKDRLEAERDRLSAELEACKLATKAMMPLNIAATLNDLVAERDRLSAALQKIDGMAPEDRARGHYETLAYDMGKVAREALAGAGDNPFDPTEGMER